MQEHTSQEAANRQEIRNQTLACLYLPAQNRSDIFCHQSPRKVWETLCGLMHRVPGKEEILWQPLTCQCKIMLHSSPSVSLWFPSTMSVPPIFTNSTCKREINSISNTAITVSRLQPHPIFLAVQPHIITCSKREQLERTTADTTLSDFVMAIS